MVKISITSTLLLKEEIHYLKKSYILKVFLIINICKIEAMNMENFD